MIGTTTDPRPAARDMTRHDRMSAGQHGLDLAEPIPRGFATLVYGLLLVVAVRLHWRDLINHDVAWLAIAAGKWLDGAHYGSAIVEINTPAAMLLYLPPAWAARLTGFGLHHLIDLWLACVALASAILSGRAAAALAGMTAQSRHAFISSFLVFSVFALYPTTETGQRDHFIALMLFPYGLMALNAAAVGFARRAAAVLAALALCIKPQYLLVVGLVFVFALLRHEPQGPWRHRFRVIWRQFDATLIILIGAVYILIVVLCFPEWLLLVRGFARVFAAYSMPTLDVFSRCTPIVALAAGAVALCFPLPGRACFAGGFVLAAAAMILMLVEGEPWPYHQLPILLFLLAGAVLSFTAALPALARCARHPLAVAAAVALVPIVLAVNSVELGLERRDNIEALLIADKLGRFARPGDPVIFLSDSLAPALSVVADRDYRWALRYPCLWPMAGAVVLQRSGRLDPTSAHAYIDQVADAVAQDIASNRPAAIVVDQRPIKQLLPTGMEILPLLMGNPAFARALQAYHPQAETAGFTVYVP